MDTSLVLGCSTLPLSAQGSQAGQLHEDPVVRQAGAGQGLEVGSPGSEGLLNTGGGGEMGDIEIYNM